MRFLLFVAGPKKVFYDNKNQNKLKVAKMLNIKSNLFQVVKCGIVESVLAWSKFKQDQQLKSKQVNIYIYAPS